VKTGGRTEIRSLFSDMPNTAHVETWYRVIRLDCTWLQQFRPCTTMGILVTSVRQPVACPPAQEVQHTARLDTPPEEVHLKSTSPRSLTAQLSAKSAPKQPEGKRPEITVSSGISA
jgi:hypothetical protein